MDQTQDFYPLEHDESIAVRMNKNVVLVVMDTARASDTWHVRDRTSKSSLHKLASEGSDFTQVFANSPWTLPSHTSIFTGTYTSKHGTHAGYKSYDGQFPTLAELLSAEGYQTVGVTNNAWVTDEFGLARGFDEFYKTWQYFQTSTDFGKIKLTSHGTNLIGEAGRALLQGNIVANFVNTIYGKFFYRRSDYGAKRTNKLIRNWIMNRNQDDPFFLFVNYLEPHLKYQPPQDFARRFLPESVSYEEAMEIPQKPWEFVAGNLELSNFEFDLLQALYCAEIAYLDEKIGELRRILEQNDEWTDTVFIIVGDHGENIGDHGLMDHQYSVHDTLLHVPLTIEGGSFNQSCESNRLIQTVDLFPTILDTIDLPVPEHSQGISFHPNSSTPSREYIVGEYLSPNPTVERLSEQTGTSKEELEKFGRQLRTIRTKEYKLIRMSSGDVDLYDLDNDPDELNKISNSQQMIYEELESKLDAWLESFNHASGGESEEMSNSTKQRLENLGYLQ